ncbi:MAG: lysylphosphatidylglycerol synthase transmembrane domain-containing protein [Candidatus Promineifilaceae bacterium]
MVSEKQGNEHLKGRRWMPWLNLLLVVILVGLGVWYLSGKVSLGEIVMALRLAHPLPIVLGVGIMLVTVLIKAWRWQLMFSGPGQQPSFLDAFWALMLGQYVNLIVPVLRLGEVARIYALNRQTTIPMARSIGTLVVEKVLDLLMLVLTLAILLPFVILPEFVGEPGPMLWLIPLAALLVLYLMAFETDKITSLLQSIARRLPDNWLQRPFQWMISGLDGLAALRSGRSSLLLVLLSAVIALLAVLLPYVLFGAFDFSLTFVQAALLNVIVTIAITPPSTPGKIGVFNGAVAILLYSFDAGSDAAIIGYSIVFHLVVVVPQILLGSIAAVKTDWHWDGLLDKQAAS